MGPLRTLQQTGLCRHGDEQATACVNLFISARPPDTGLSVFSKSAFVNGVITSHYVGETAVTSRDIYIYHIYIPYYLDILYIDVLYIYTQQSVSNRPPPHIDHSLISIALLGSHLKSVPWSIDLERFYYIQ